MRNLERERRNHAAAASARTAALYDQLQVYLPDSHQLLAGYAAILAFLDRLSVKRPNGQPITATQLRRWRRDRDLPIAPGYSNLTAGPRRYRCPPFTSTHAITAWVIHHHRLDGRLFRVYLTPLRHAA